MTEQQSDPAAATQANRSVPDVDAVVVGAGFAGLYALHRLRAHGPLRPRVRAGRRRRRHLVLEPLPRRPLRHREHRLLVLVLRGAAAGVDLDRALRRPSPRSSRYLNHVADRFDLRPRHPASSTAGHRAVYDEAPARWTIETDRGDRVTARFCVMAVGCLSVGRIPEFPGLDTFRGAGLPHRHWPQEGVDFAGKRVGVIGTGSSGIQSIPLIAQQAAHLTVFQRTAELHACRRATRRSTLSWLADLKAARTPSTGAGVAGPRGGSEPRLSERRALEVTPQRAAQVYEARLGLGGAEHPRRRSATCSSTREANETAAEFVRAQDPRDRRRPRGGRRGSCPTATRSGPSGCASTPSYYETYNRDNVTLVDVQVQPRSTRSRRAGIRTASAGVRARRDRLRHRVRRHDRRAARHRHPRPRRTARCATSGRPGRAPTWASRSPGSRTCSSSPARAARRCSATWSCRSSSTSTGSPTASSYLREHEHRRDRGDAREAEDGWVGARQRGRRPHPLPGRRTPGTWARTFPASRECSCPTSAASAGTERSATRLPPPATPASTWALRDRRQRLRQMPWRCSRESCVPPRRLRSPTPKVRGASRAARRSWRWPFRPLRTSSAARGARRWRPAGRVASSAAGLRTLRAGVRGRSRRPAG